MNGKEFRKLMGNREGTYHLVDEQGRRLVRQETDAWLFGTFVDYKNGLVLFEDPDPKRFEDTTLKLILDAAAWVPRTDDIRKCPCDTSRCEGQLLIRISNDSPTEGWTLVVK